MSTAAPIKYITDGLGFHIDLGNPKSLVGEPTTNYFYTPTPDGSNVASFSVQGDGTFYRVWSGNYGGYEIKPTDVVYRFDLSARVGCWYHGNDYNIPAGSHLTFAFDYYVNATGYPYTNYLAAVEDGGNGISMTAADPTPSLMGGWKRIEMISGGTSTGTGSSRFLLYPGGCIYYLGTGGYILFKNPQAEGKPYSTPFVMSGASTPGVRSNSQAIADMTGTQTCTANVAVGFSNDHGGAMTGSGIANNNVAITNPLYYNLGNNNFTYMSWVKIASDAQMCLYEERGGSLVGTLWVMNYGGNVGYMALFLTDKPYVGQKIYPQPSSFGSVAGSIHHFAVVADRSNGVARFFKDGISYGTADITPSPNSITPDSDFLCSLMYDKGGNHFNGLMYTFSIYPNAALTQAQIQQNFDSARSRFGL